MKRTLIAAGLVATLAFAAIALGAVKHYRGPIEQGGNVTFDTKVKHHKVKNVKSFFFYKLTLSCEDGELPNLTNDPIFPIPPMTVDHREFHGDFYNAEFKTSGHVKGAFSDHFRKASGTLEDQGPPGSEVRQVRHRHRRLDRREAVARARD